MRIVLRIAAGALLLLPATGAACGSTDRPEGIVERWLVALDQGAAGRPDAYAEPSVSDRLLPGWRDHDPGAFDVIEVGRGGPNGATYRVPFRIVAVDGGAFRGTATVAGGRVVDVARRPAGEPFPSEGGRPIADADAWAWLAAGAAALGLTAVSTALMRLMPGRTTRQRAASS